jgi:hypothetical protein
VADEEAEFVLAAAGPPEPPAISWAKESPIDGAAAEIDVTRTSAKWHFSDGSILDQS